MFFFSFLFSEVSVPGNRHGVENTSHVLAAAFCFLDSASFFSRYHNHQKDLTTVANRSFLTSMTTKEIDI